MDRRTFLLAGAAIAGSFAKPASAQPPALAVTLGGWRLEIPEYLRKQIDATLDVVAPGDLGNLIRGAAKAVTESASLVHLYIKIPHSNENIYIHGFPCNPVTRERMDFDNLKGSVLQVTALTKREHERELLRTGHQEIEFTSYFPMGGVAVEHVLGEVFDMGEVINQAQMSYQPITLDKNNPPVNSNAATAAGVYSFGGCKSPDHARELEAVYLNRKIFAPGINRGLPGQFMRAGVYKRHAGRYEQQADAGQSWAALVTEFTGRNPMKLAYSGDPQNLYALNRRRLLLGAHA